MTSLQDAQKAAGAIFSELDNLPLTFNHDSFSIDKVFDGAFMCDRTSCGIIEITGEDRLSFIHNQTTNKIQSLKSGEGCNTVFVNSTGRNIDLVTVLVQEEKILLLTSPQQNQPLMEWMDRYIFPFDKVHLKDLTGEYTILNLIGKQTTEILSQWISQSPLNAPEFHHHNVKIEDIDLILIVGSSLKITGYTLLIPQEKAPLIWQKLTAKNVVPIGTQEYETLRILQGKPQPNAELTTDYNPLETGLWDAISFDKGCYIGQETIARLNTYKGVKQKLWGIKLKNKIDPSEDNLIMLNGEKIGKMTSYIDTEEGGFALGYIRTKAGDIGLKVTINNTVGEVIPLTFVNHPTN